MAGTISERRADYRHFLAITTRWGDNDVYGHVSSAVYFTYLDSAVNHYLITQGGLDIHNGPVIGFTVETSCRFHRQLKYPGMIDAGLRVDKLGNSSVHYAVGLFSAGENAPAATGQFIHVFVDRATARPVALPPRLRSALAAIAGAAHASDGDDLRARASAGGG